jgi:hypothetical protein
MSELKVPFSEDFIKNHYEISPKFITKFNEVMGIDFKEYILQDKIPIVKFIKESKDRLFGLYKGLKIVLKENEASSSYTTQEISSYTNQNEGFKISSLECNNFDDLYAYDICAVLEGRSFNKMELCFILYEVFLKINVKHDYIEIYLNKFIKIFQDLIYFENISKTEIYDIIRMFGPKLTHLFVTLTSLIDSNYNFNKWFTKRSREEIHEEFKKAEKFPLIYLRLSRSNFGELVISRKMSKLNRSDHFLIVNEGGKFRYKIGNCKDILFSTLYDLYYSDITQKDS